MAIDNNIIVSHAYEQYAAPLVNYVSMRINDYEEALDIVQDVFVRLLGCDIVTTDTVKSLCYRIANNLVIDHIRRHYKRQEVMSYVFDMERSRPSLTPEQVAAFHDLAEKERCLMMELTPCTARVYEMSQIQGMTIDEIATTLNISRRTVECHQLNGRKRIRERMRKII